MIIAAYHVLSITVQETFMKMMPYISFERICIFVSKFIDSFKKSGCE